MVNSSCSTGGNRRVAVVTNLVISHEPKLRKFTILMLFHCSIYEQLLLILPEQDICIVLLTLVESFTITV
jgi:hypothetical protein